MKSAVKEVRFYEDFTGEVTRVPPCSTQEKGFLDVHIKRCCPASCLCFIFLSSADLWLPLSL